jgi:O-glycosyl hydrolase
MRVRCPFPSPAIASRPAWRAALVLSLLSWLVAPAAAAEAPRGVTQDAAPAAVSFELGREEFRIWGGRTGSLRVYFPECLPALFERTLDIESLPENGSLDWVFTGDRAGVTVRIQADKVVLLTRYHDSFAFNAIGGKTAKHPEWSSAPAEAACAKPPKSVAVRMDHALGLTVLVDGEKAVASRFLHDLRRHQVQAGAGAAARGALRFPPPRAAAVRVDPSKRHQEMIGFGGIATPTAYAQLSLEGRRRWWELACAYNLLIQREYPIGTRLKSSMDNWDVLADATPHYYGDNFPNGEISDFDYLRILRRLGGQVWFEFWDLPPWVGTDAEKYAEAMAAYCKVSKARAGAPPDIVGIQNEKIQTPETWHRMTRALRRALDGAGFNAVRIHMSDDPNLQGGIRRARAFAESKDAWDLIDFSATHLYDYQGFFTKPDDYDARLAEWKEATAGKPFLSTELCINAGGYQVPDYRIALSMGQLYHKNLVLADAAAICYCWTLLNVEQPSYGYTRTLCVPDPAQGFVPAAPSGQLRVFGAYSRRIRKGMRRVEAASDCPDVLVSAFEGSGGARTLVALNRGTAARRLRIAWPGAAFAEMEVADPYNANTVRPAPAAGADGAIEASIDPGAIVTLTNVPLGRLPENVIEQIRGNLSR